MGQKIKNIFRLLVLLSCFGCGFLNLPASEPDAEQAAPAAENTADGESVEVADSLQEEFDNASATLEALLEATSDFSGSSSEPEENPATPEADNPEEPVEEEAAPTRAVATLPPVDIGQADVEIGPVVTPTFFPPVYTDTSLQLQTFDEFWTIINEEYVYPDFNGVDWEGIRPQYRARVEAGMTNPEFWNLLSEMVYLLDDEHSYVVGTDKSEGIRDLIRKGVGFSGVGVSMLGKPDQGHALAAWVIPGNGLYEAGVRSGDLIIAADGHPICCQPNGDPFEFLLGPAGTTVDVTYQAVGQPVKTVSVERRPIELNEAMLGERLTGDIAYIQINTFLVHTVYDDFVALWDELNQPTPVKGVIFDLRQNTGGLVNPSNRILGHFVEGTLFYYYDSYVESGRLIPRTLGGGENIHGSMTVPIVSLVGEGTNSRGEVFAGFIRDLDRGITIGRPTNANIESITPYDLPDGSLLYIATESLVPTSGDDWEANGLTLDIVIDQRFGEIARDGRDEALEAAIDALSR